MRNSFILFLFLFGCASAQYDPNISGYHLYWYHLDIGQTPAIDHTFKSDTTINISWERGEGSEPGYSTPYNGVYGPINAIVNSPSLWNADTAVVQKTITLSDGIYELTVTEADINENESSHSQPLFIEIKAKYARVQINVRIE